MPESMLGSMEGKENVPSSVEKRRSRGEKTGNDFERQLSESGGESHDFVDSVLCAAEKV